MGSQGSCSIDPRPTARIRRSPHFYPGGHRWYKRTAWWVEMSLEERIYLVRRASCRGALMRAGQSAELAERWCEAWEREVELEGRAKSSESWDAGMRWINAQIVARRSPDAVLVHR